MYQCKNCEMEFTDGAQCSMCMGWYDFQCSGITEEKYRKIEERKYAWGCALCKSSLIDHQIPRRAQRNPGLRYNTRVPVKVLPDLVKEVQHLKKDLAEFQTIKCEFTNMLTAFDEIKLNIKDLKEKIANLNGGRLLKR